MPRLIPFLFLFLLFNCAPDLEKVKKITADMDTVAEKGSEVEILYSDLGKLKVKIIAEELTYHQGKEPYSEFNKGLRAFFYNPAMEIESKLSANYGVIYDEKGEMLVRDDVVVINVKGEKLNTEELIWKKKEEKVFSDKFVKITTPEEIIYGEGFEASQDFSDYTIKNITGIIQVKGEDTGQSITE